MPQAATAVPEAGLDLQTLRTEIDRIAAQYVTEDAFFLVLGDGSLRRRARAGDRVKTLAICGNLRLCVSHNAGEGR